jgi:hypothetical protein
MFLKLRNGNKNKLENLLSAMTLTEKECKIKQVFKIIFYEIFMVKIYYLLKYMFCLIKKTIV